MQGILGLPTVQRTRYSALKSVHLRKLHNYNTYILVQPSGSASVIPWNVMVVTIIHVLQYQTKVKQAHKNTPLTPNVGPWEGCRRQAKELSWRWAERAWTRPMVTVLFPSPRGVGVILKNTDRKHYQHMLSHIQREWLYIYSSFCFPNFRFPSDLTTLDCWQTLSPSASSLPLSQSLWSNSFGRAVKACQWLTVIE